MGKKILINQKIRANLWKNMHKKKLEFKKMAIRRNMLKRIVLMDKLLQQNQLNIPKK
jgi:hypothetical protein